MYWHSGWNEPVVSVPSTQEWGFVLESIIEELEKVGEKNGTK